MMVYLSSLVFVVTLVVVQQCSVDALHLIVPILKSPVLSSIQMSFLSSDQQNDNGDDDDDDFILRPCSIMNQQRRSLLHKAAALLVTTTAAAAATTTASTAPACWASGGATAGRYTTIPIAKRRYYGRVQQAVHEFVDMGKDMISQDTAASASSSTKILNFFDLQGTVIVPSKNKDVNGQCTKKDGDCRGKEIRDSRWNDMKASMYLLGNAFRTDQQKPPDRLPTVKAARAFFQKVDAMEKMVVKNKSKVKDTAVVQLYVDALDILDTYLDLVELPPIDSGHYEKEFDTLVGESARIT